MFNPLVDNFSKLSDNEVEEKISELGRKYWMTRNPEVQMQIATILEMYKSEAYVRRASAYSRAQNEQNGESGLDSLINVS